MAKGITLSVQQVDYLNIVLMLASAALAFVLPFELFMFSYVALGPLHYLTEMAWLHQRRYFLQGERSWWPLLLCGLGVMVFYLADFLLPYVLSTTDAAYQQWSSLFRNWVLNFVLAAFVIAMVLVAVADRWWRLMLTCLALAVIILLNPYRDILIASAILIPTIVHTCLFMLAFIVFGAMKSNKLSGYLSVAVFLVCCMSFFVTDWGIGSYAINPGVLQNLQEGFFLSVNDILGSISGNRFSSVEETLYSPWGIRIQQFIAFSYTYHYLNWFSKTNIINWHRMPRTWGIGIVGLWVLFVLLYLADFKTGLVAIFLLSMLHVFLEFPLNYRSIMGIGTNLYGRFKPSSK